MKINYRHNIEINMHMLLIRDSQFSPAKMKLTRSQSKLCVGAIRRTVIKTGREI